MRKSCLSIAFVFLVCAFCAAQTPSTFEQVKAYGGYEFTHLDTHAVQDVFNLQHVIDPTFPQFNFGNYQNLHGWNFGVEEDTLAKWFGVVVDVSGSYGTNSIDLGTVSGVSSKMRTKLRTYTFTGGPQFTLRRSDKIQPFVRALFGGGWVSFSSNVFQNNVPEFADLKGKDAGFAYGGGGGADFFFKKKVGLRVAVDLIRTPFFDDTQNNIRGTAGLVFRF